MPPSSTFGHRSPSPYGIIIRMTLPIALLSTASTLSAALLLLLLLLAQHLSSVHGGGIHTTKYPAEACPSGGPNLIKDGDFERCSPGTAAAREEQPGTPLPGCPAWVTYSWCYLWSRYCSPESLKHQPLTITSPGVAGSAHSLRISSRGSAGVSQNISTVPGATYQMDFWVANRGSTTCWESTLIYVYISPVAPGTAGGGLIFDRSTKYGTELKPGTGWTHLQTSFPAVNAITEVTIYTAGLDYGLDNVSIIKC